MCGIVGVVGKISKVERSVFDQLLIVDSLRGSDSTGFATIKGAEVDVFKIAGDPYFAKENKAYDRALIKPTNVLIGHNRYATTGKVNRQNAHPFEFPTVVGVHNGTLTNKYQLPDGYMFEVDSEALYNAIDTIGTKAAVGKAQGAWSLVWYNKVNKTLHLLRNEERPMSFCYSEDKKTLFFASEAHMLLWILHRNGVKHTPIQLTNVDKLLTMPVKEEFEGAATPLADFEVEEVKGAPKVFYQAPQANAGGSTGAVVSIASINKFLNTTVQFYTDGGLNIDTEHYIKGETWYGQKQYSVLIPTQRDANFCDMLLDDNEDTGYLTFTGIVRSVRSHFGEQYLVIDKASVKGLEKLKKQTASTSKTARGVKYPGYKGESLTRIQWRDLTAYGCASCGEFPQEHEAKRLQWVDRFNFHCQRCTH